jgi:hypothetical protein
MKRRQIPRATATLPLPEQYAPYLSAGTVEIFNPAAPMVNSAYNVKPWPIAGDRPRGLGYIAPQDDDFATRNGAENGLNWQRTEFHSNPIWARHDVIAAAKELERDLFIRTPQNRMHDLSQFHSAFVSQPPQNQLEIPDYPY